MAAAGFVESVDPTTGAPFQRWELDDDTRVEAILDASHRAAVDWATRPVEERVDVLRRVGGLLRERRVELADLMTREMGKRTPEALGEVDKCASVCEHYADRAAAVLSPHVVTDHPDALIRHDPLGPLLAVMPWNFPLWQVLRVAAPNLAAGNTIVLKHAPNVTGCADALERLLGEAGEADLLRKVVVDVEQVGRIIDDRRIAAVTLTGSPRAGAAVGARAGAALKKSVLELGGSDAFVVLADADLPAAVEAAASSRLLNAGQTCISAKRFIVEQSVHDEFLDRLRARFDAVLVGDPTDDEVELGPMAREDLRAEIAGQLERGLAQGATKVTSVSAPDRPGWFHAPTLVTNVERDNVLMREETFGPVAPVVPVAGAEGALAVANDTTFGLGAAIWTADRDRALDLAARLRVGAVAVNDIVKSDPRLPFGGVGDSGHGRELGDAGLLEFTNVKSIAVGSP